MAKNGASEIESRRRAQGRWIEELIEAQNDKLWDSIAKNYEWISHAQISNSFILFLALNEAKKALTAGEISEIIAQKSKGHLYKFPPTLRDALEYRLKREGLVDDEIIANTSSPKPRRYFITCW